MTTVAWDGSVLAADRKMGDWFNVPKIFRLPQGRCAAGAGDYDAISLVVRWITDGAPPDQKPDIGKADASVIVVDPVGSVTWYVAPLLRPQVLTEPFMALGSGECFALGALAAGSGARRAVEIACDFDPHSGKGVDTVRVVKKGTRK